MEESTRLPTHYINRSHSVIESHVMKLKVHGYVDVNARGGLVSRALPAFTVASAFSNSAL